MQGANCVVSRGITGMFSKNSGIAAADLTSDDSQIKPDNIQPPRLFELDLLKALSVIAMVFCHPVIRLGIHRAGYESDWQFFLGDVILGDYLGVAHAFMFAMGVGMVYSRKNAPADLMRRGVKIYLLGYVLNFCRYGVYALAEGLISGVFEPETLEALFGPDILQFAGLALFFTGVLKQLRLREGHMLVIGLALSVAGTAVPFIDTGSYALNWLLGHLVYTTWDASCFVFCNWYIFVGAGLLFGAFLRRTEHRDRFYIWLVITSGCAMAVYLSSTVKCGALFLCRERVYYAVSTLEAAGLLSIDLFLLSVFHFLLRRIPVSRLRVFIEMSRNLTPIYLIHWCILGFIDSIFCYLMELSFSWLVIYGIGAALLVMSGWIAKRWTDRKQPAMCE